MSRPLPDFAKADAFARALMKDYVDVNEVEKSFGHLRVFLTEAQAQAKEASEAAESWWRWLDTVTSTGAEAVVRSNKRHYAPIRHAALAHLKGLEPAILAQTMGWGVRLMRYYKEIPGASGRAALFTPPPAPRTASPSEANPRKAPPAKPPPAQPKLPEVGQSILGKVVDIDERGVFLEIKDFPLEQAFGLIRPERLEGKQFQIGNQARVEVIAILQNEGTVQVELKAVPKKK